jgi:hypothetical protein
MHCYLKLSQIYKQHAQPQTHRQTMSCTNNCADHMQEIIRTSL